MKLRKQIKNRIVMVGMLAVMLFCGFWSLDFSVVYADTVQPYDFRIDPLNNKNQYELYKLYSFSGQRFAVYNPDGEFFGIAFISTSEWDRQCTYLRYQAQYGGGYKLEKEDSSHNLGEMEFVFNEQKYYIGYYSSIASPRSFKYSGNLGHLYKTSLSNINELFRSMICDYISDSKSFLSQYECTEVSSGEDISTDGTTWEGGQDKPKKDTDIGYLVLKNTNVNQQSDFGALKDGALPLYFNIDWKDKTTTGFSLTKNKYARTFIQMEVESKFVVYSDVKHTKIKHKFDNYGERGWLSKNIDPSNKPITFDSGDINNALPLTYNEILNQVDKNKIYGSLGQAIFPIGYNFLIRYRIVCTDSLTVIPDTSFGWHAGPWASTTLSGDDINDTSSDKSDHEGYGDDKNKNGETDDINHTRTDYDDNQDAKDNINDKKNDKSSLDLDSAKEFINQVADVPKMIGDLFSFFPNWVKYTVELGFAFIFILIVYKLIRG